MGPYWSWMALRAWMKVPFRKERELGKRLNIRVLGPGKRASGWKQRR